MTYLDRILGQRFKIAVIRNGGVELGSVGSEGFTSFAPIVGKDRYRCSLTEGDAFKGCRKYWRGQVYNVAKALGGTDEVYVLHNSRKHSHVPKGKKFEPTTIYVTVRRDRSDEIVADISDKAPDGEYRGNAN